MHLSIGALAVWTAAILAAASIAIAQAPAGEGSPSAGGPKVIEAPPLAVAPETGVAPARSPGESRSGSAVPRSGLGAVPVEPGRISLDVTNAVARFRPRGVEGEAAFASYLIDLQNRAPAPVSRILSIDVGAFGGGFREPRLGAPRLLAVIASSAGAVTQIVETGVRTRVRVDLPAGETVTIALRFSEPAPGLAVELWDEIAAAESSRALVGAQGLVLGLALAFAAYLTGLAVVRGEGSVRRAALALWLAFFALFAASGFLGPFEIAGRITHASLAQGAFALAVAAAASAVAAALGLTRRRGATGAAARYAPWAIAAAGLAAALNAPFGAAAAQAAIGLGLLGSIVVVLVRALEGQPPARDLAAAAVLALLAGAPVGLQYFQAGGGATLILFASALFAASLLAFGFAAARSTSPSGGTAGRAAASLRPPDAPAAAPPPPAPEGREDRTGLAVAAAHLGIFDWDLAADRLELSPSVEALLGAKPGELAGSGRDWRSRVHPDDFDTFRSAFEQYREMGDVSFALDFRARGHDGQWRWLQLQGSMMSDGEKPVRCIGVVGDVSAQKEHEAALHAAIRHDGLTGLPTRAAFMDALGSRLSEPESDAPAALLVLDVDRFRTANDALGPQAGDALIAALAERLRRAAPDHALAARLGGDRFALLWTCDESIQAEETANDVLAALAEPMALAGTEIFPSASGGLVRSTPGTPAAAALSDAETALAAAKRAGGGQTAVFAPAMRAPAQDRLAVESDLRRALERGEIEIHYQPVVRVETRALAGFEALLRWRHPARGLLSADAFVPLAEETGLIVPLGRHALMQAVERVRAWRAIAGAPQDFFVGVNVSARQLGRADFLRLCEETLDAAALPPGAVRFEVTETLVLENPEAAHRALRRLKALGASLAIDDFGIGQSTMQRLAGLPFDTVKIDKSFLLAEDAASPRRAALVEGIVAMARGLGLAAVAEGVETEAAFDWLASLGCDFAQGYLFGPPLEAAAADRLVAEAAQESAAA